MLGSGVRAACAVRVDERAIRFAILVVSTTQLSRAHHLQLAHSRYEHTLTFHRFFGTQDSPRSSNAPSTRETTLRSLRIFRLNEPSVPATRSSQSHQSRLESLHQASFQSVLQASSQLDKLSLQQGVRYRNTANPTNCFIRTNSNQLTQHNQLTHNGSAIRLCRIHQLTRCGW